MAPRDLGCSHLGSRTTTTFVFQCFRVGLVQHLSIQIGCLVIVCWPAAPHTLVHILQAAHCTLSWHAWWAGQFTLLRKLCHSLPLPYALTCDSNGPTNVCGQNTWQGHFTCRAPVELLWTLHCNDARPACWISAPPPSNIPSVIDDGTSCYVPKGSSRWIEWLCRNHCRSPTKFQESHMFADNQSLLPTSFLLFVWTNAGKQSNASDATLERTHAW